MHKKIIIFYYYYKMNIIFFKTTLVLFQESHRVLCECVHVTKALLMWPELCFTSVRTQSEPTEGELSLFCCLNVRTEYEDVLLWWPKGSTVKERRLTRAAVLSPSHCFLIGFFDEILKEEFTQQWQRRHYPTVRGRRKLHDHKQIIRDVIYIV